MDFSFQKLISYNFSSLVMIVISLSLSLFYFGNHVVSFFTVANGDLCILCFFLNNLPKDLLGVLSTKASLKIYKCRKVYKQIYSGKYHPGCNIEC